MEMDYFLDGGHMERVLESAVSVGEEDYYVKMAAGWCLAECYAADPEKTVSRASSVLPASSPLPAALTSRAYSDKILPLPGAVLPGFFYPTVHIKKSLHRSLF